MKPFLRWAGSKRQLLPELRKYCRNRNTRYIEPFAGSACLYFEIEPHTALINDLNKDLIDTYRMVKNDPYLVIECLKRLPVGKDNYYKIRNLYNDQPLLAEKAAIFIYLNKFCFNGLYRTNKKGEFNVPFGDSKNCTEIDYDLIIQASKILENAILINEDFEKIIKYVQKDDFVYLDPPFWSQNIRIFSEYQATPFGSNDLERLESFLFKISNKGAKFVVSYIDSHEGMSVLSNCRITKIKTNRYISGKAQNRRSVYEIIATNIDGVN